MLVGFQLISKIPTPDMSWRQLGHISVGSQDLANENQDDTYIMCFAVRHCRERNPFGHVVFQSSEPRLLHEIS